MSSKDRLKLHAKDSKKRGSKWSSCFVAPEIPPPETDIEKRAVEILAECGVNIDKAVTVHIYNVLAAVELALESRGA